MSEQSQTAEAEQMQSGNWNTQKLHVQQENPAGVCDDQTHPDMHPTVTEHDRQQLKPRTETLPDWLKYFW